MEETFPEKIKNLIYKYYSHYQIFDKNDDLTDVGKTIRNIILCNCDKSIILLTLDRTDVEANLNIYKELGYEILNIRNYEFANQVRYDVLLERKGEIKWKN